MRTTGANQPFQLLLDVLDLVTDLRIPYAVVGALAVSAMKIFAGGVQDLIDVRGILKVSEERLDLELLRQLARRYGPPVARKLEELLNE